KDAKEDSGEKGSKEKGAKEDSGEKGSKTGAAKGRRSLPEISLQGVKDALQDFRENLGQKGIHQRELFMIGAGIVLVILIIVLVVNSIGASMEEKKKAEHVTADEGLTVTVEKEPEQWCSTYPVELRFRTRGSAVSRITVDGTVYTPDEQGKITVEASDYLLHASVTTDQGELSAQIEIPMIDAQAPVVNVAREDERITVTAADARSSVTGIWYAAVENNAFIQIPLYQEYSEPLTFEKNTTYYFYAKDAAGNRSRIIVTTMEPAQELVLKTEKLSLFPGETGYLQLTENPAGALLNNLKFESANPEVATVDSSGAVTAVNEGSTVVNVSADGVDPVSCTVEVSNERTVTISAIGDCTLGTDENFNTTTSFNAFEAVNGYSYFFQNVRDILENDDATFANLEGTFTTETARENKQYAFKGDPSYTEILKSGSVEVVTLANNHSSDYGEKSLEDTKQYLKEAEIDYCTGDEIVLRDVNGIKTAFIGIYVLNDGMARESQVRETIAAAKEQGAQLVIIAFHWGSEREGYPDETQQSLAHIAVDCGADLVVGHHPHVLQGIENYNGKYIVYSLGNFCFGGNSAPSDMDTIIFRQTFTVGQEGVLPDSQIEIVPCSISSEIGYNDYQPTPAQGTEAERIIERINEASSVYGQTFTASDGLDPH
ncbi:MAG: CapA family protein, partial [Lachnospiraceae bacterium]|nr:CapA family protein [Lachnospiraceae bacterium]